MAETCQSWGRYPVAADQTLVRLRDRHGLPALDPGRRYLAYGNGRSYGDVCLNEGGVLLLTRGLDNFIAFDPAAGEIRCEAGVLLSDILDFIVPRGWFLPVVPGTKLVTVGGAIANDVHGKNHHNAGTFGCHVAELRLLRSDGADLVCSPDVNADLFAATIGGLGLTGIIAEARIKLRPVSSSRFEGEQIRIANLDEFFELTEEAGADFDYSAAWIDCLAAGDRLGRGFLLRANHASGGGFERSNPLPLSLPVTPPVSPLNRLTLKAFNSLYMARQRVARARKTWHYDSYLFPLDAIGGWNKAYGPRGFLQYQCVVPAAAARDASRALLGEISRSGQGSPLVVFKTFGGRKSPGMLSFPMEGATLALDFSNRGAPTLALLDRLDAIVAEAGGRLYPAKDARMPPAMFRQGYPALDMFRAHVDPLFSSGFQRRVMGAL